MSSAPKRDGHSALRSLDDRPFVLVIHRSPTIRHALLITLDLDGFDVLTMEDHSEAGDIFAYAPPSVIIADLAGASVAQSEFLRRAQSAHVPVIAFDERAAASTHAAEMVTGVQHIRRQDGVSHLLDVLHEITEPPLALRANRA